MSDKSFGRKMTGSEGINQVYRKYKLNYFPKLLENSNIASEDKTKLKELLKKHIKEASSPSLVPHRI